MLPSAFRLRLLLVALLLCLPALAAQARRPRIARSHGILTQVPTPDLRGPLVLEAGNETLTLKAAPDMRVFIEPYPHEDPDKPEARLEVGSAAEVEYNPDTRTTAWVMITATRVVTHRVGILTSADPGTGLTFQPVDPDAEPPRPSERLYANERTRLFLNTLPLTLAELPLLVGQPVDLLLYNELADLERLRATVTPSPSSDWVVQSVNPTDRSLRITRPGSATDLNVPAHLEPNTAVGAIPFSAILPGDRIRLKAAQLASGANVALDLRLQGVPARAAVGRLTWVDQVHRSVRISGREPYRFFLTPDTPILYHYPKDESYLSPYPIILDDLAAAGPDYDGVVIRMVYLVRGGRRIPMRLDVTRDGYPPL